MKKILIVILSLVMILGLVGCSVDVPVREKNSVEKATIANEKSVATLIGNDKLPTITKSLERENIKRRVEFINQPDRIGYLYLLSDNGQLIKEVQVLGKASSLNNYITPMEQLTLGKIDDYPSETYVTEAPDLDGTWGTRPEGIFWFTPDGVYQEWTGLYLYSSERMTFTTKPLLIENIEK
ncbi:MAG: hypothetical protein K0R54_2255 [Clostridiaceae bacterium]|nr:hypothetical protein [Clostridiaceae bacterium]